MEDKTKKIGSFNIEKLAEACAERLNKQGYITEVKRRRGRYPSYNVFYKRDGLKNV